MLLFLFFFIILKKLKKEIMASPYFVYNNNDTNKNTNNKERNSTTNIIIDESILLSSQLPLQQEDVYAFTKNSATGVLLSWFSRGLIWMKRTAYRSKKIILRRRRGEGGDSDSDSSCCNTTNYQGVAVAGFAAMLWVSAATSLLGPMRDAAALAVGVKSLPNLTLASTVLALGSSVPVGWLFEAPDPTLTRRLVLRRMGFTRGDTHGTSLALFYRTFAIVLICYAILFFLFLLPSSSTTNSTSNSNSNLHKSANVAFFLVVHLMKLHSISLMWGVVGQALDYEEKSIKLHRRKQQALHFIKKHNKLQQQQQQQQQMVLGYHKDSSSTIDSKDSTSQEEGSPNTTNTATSNWNTTSNTNTTTDKSSSSTTNRARISRLAFVGFGGTLGGIIGSFIASSTAHLLRISGLLLLSALILIFSANLSIELGTLMHRHWEEQQIVRNWEEFTKSTTTRMLQQQSTTTTTTTSTNTTTPTNTTTNTMIRASKSMGCMKRLATSTTTTTTSSSTIDNSLELPRGSIGTMKRVASGNSLAAQQKPELQQSNFNNNTTTTTTTIKRSKSLSSVMILRNMNNATATTSEKQGQPMPVEVTNENSFSQRLLRGVTTIVRSRLLMAIFTYNALYASTTVLLSFQRAELVANRKTTTSTSRNHAEADTAFLAKINTVSNVAVFALQACGLGAFLAHACGQRGTLVLMPLCRLCGVLLLLGWHVRGHGQPPDLTLFLLLDELTRVINFAVAKPVREGLWRGLSNEARYEAKPIVDTLANRWGSGSAAFLVSLMDRMLSFLSWVLLPSNASIIRDDRDVDDKLSIKSVFGFPPLLLLCLIISAWWVMVSLHLGHTRSRIDVELKKHQ